MARSISTKPAVLPLPAGKEGATVRLHPLLCGEIAGPEGWFLGPAGLRALPRAIGIGVPRARWLAVPIPAFLIEHPSAGPIMVDTGFHSSVIDSDTRRANLGLVGTLMAKELQLSCSQTAAARLRALGIDPHDVHLIVMTHLHFDHASALADFPEATVIVAEPEWRAATGPRAAFGGYSQAQLAPGLSYQTLDFHGPGTDGHGPFKESHDLFGDGSVVLVNTAGHSLGHMSLLVRLTERQALIAGDAIYTMATLEEGRRPWRSEDPAAFDRSLAAIQAYHRENPDALVIPGHDMELWKTLEPIYD